MADYKVTDIELTSIANAIRTKGGTQAQLEFPTGFVSAVQAIPTGGGGGNITIPGAVLLTPYAEDLAIGYVSGRVFHAYSNNYADCRTDVYKLEPEDGSRRLLLILDGMNPIGNRWRIMQTTTDPTTLPVGVSQTITGEYGKQPRYNTIGKWYEYNSDTDTSDSPRARGQVWKVEYITETMFLFLGKTNENIDGIKRLVIDITNMTI